VGEGAVGFPRGGVMGQGAEGYKGLNSVGANGNSSVPHKEIGEGEK